MIFKQTFSWNLWLILLGTFTCFLVWCESNNRKYQSMIDLPGFELTYNWNVKLESIPLKSDDKDEIIWLYQEVWDEIGYRDSLLIAKKYSRWMWINAFVQDNLDVLNTQWLTLSNLSKTQIRIEKYGEKINAVLVEYEVTEWFIEEVPILHFVQLFIPDWENIILLSFITENESSANSASNMFTNIK
jgi:hypothetical protein